MFLDPGLRTTCGCRGGGDRILGHKVRYGVRDLLFHLLLLETPAVEGIFALRDRIVVALDLGLVVGGELVELGLQLAVLFELSGFEIFDLFLLDAFEGVQSLVAADGVKSWAA